MARRSDVEDALRLDPLPTDLVVGSPTDLRPGWERSYLADKRLVQWRPPTCVGTRWAVDAEIADQPVPRVLAKRTGIHQPAAFWPAWTAAEIAAKILDVPMVMWLSEHGLSPRAAADLDVVWRTFAWSGLVVSLGGRFWPDLKGRYCY